MPIILLYAAGGVAIAVYMIAALLRPDQPLLVELTYFWALTASLQAVITPDLNQAFPDVLYFTYYATHCGAIAAACLDLLRQPRSAWTHELDLRPWMEKW